MIPGADLEPIAVESSEARPLSAEERARKEAEEEERAQREAALTGDGEEEESPASRAPAKMESGSRFQATGKRKRSIARVTLLPGDGKFEINGRGLEEFFPRPLHQTMAKQPLTTTGYETTVDVRVRVHGGGIGGQAGAVRHGIAAGADRDRPGAARRAQAARLSDPRRAGQGAPQGGPQEGPQEASVLQALSGPDGDGAQTLRYRRGPRRGGHVPQRGAGDLDRPRRRPR